MNQSIAPSEYSASQRPLSSWARPKGVLLNDLEAGMLAGATLASVDAIVRSEAAFIGVWRCRLALAAAAASTKMMGRNEDVGELRDSWFLRRTGDDPGPAGGHLLAWRELNRQTASLSPQTLRRAAEAFGLHLEKLFPEIITIVEGRGRDHCSPLCNAARVVAGITRLRPQAELLACWLADLVLARSLRWSAPLPLLASQIASAGPRAATGRVPKPTDEGWERYVAVSYAHACAAAVDLAGDLSRRSIKLNAVVPKLRAKGASSIIAALLDDDALAPSSRLGGMSDRGLRRLCDRLVALGAVRELTDRASFRLYGL